MVIFNTVVSVEVKDVLNNEKFKVSNSSRQIEIPLRIFRFINIELNEGL